jgi:hypothetical protein
MIQSFRRFSTKGATRPTARSASRASAKRSPVVPTEVSGRRKAAFERTMCFGCDGSPRKTDFETVVSSAPSRSSTSAPRSTIASSNAVKTYGALRIVSSCFTCSVTASNVDRVANLTVTRMLFIKINPVGVR